MKAFERFDAIQGFSDEEIMMLEQVRRLADDVLLREAETNEENGTFPFKSMAALQQLGMFGVCIPEQFGGTPITYKAYLNAVQMISEACSASGIIFGTTMALVHPLKMHGTEEQKARILPKIAEGAIGALALTEPHAGSDATDPKTTFTPDGDNIVVSGNKIFITSGDVADFILVFGKWKSTDEHNGKLSALIIDKGTPGFNVLGRERKMGMHASSTASLAFEDCKVAREQLVGLPGDGLKIMLDTLNKSRPSVAAHALGIARAAFKDAVSYANERAQGGKPIIRHQAIQFMLADYLAELIQTQSLMNYVGDLVDDGQNDIGAESSMIKIKASDLAMRLTTDAVQVHGGSGYCKPQRVERLMRDAKITQIWEGTNQIQRGVIGRSLITS